MSALPYVEMVADYEVVDGTIVPSGLSLSRSGRRRFLRLAGALAVGAAGPAAGAAFAGGEVFPGAGNASGSRVGFFGVFYPADPFVARQWGDVFPLGEHGWIGLQGLPQVVRQSVHDATADGAVFHDGRLPFAAMVARFAGWFCVRQFSDIGIIVQMML